MVCVSVACVERSGDEVSLTHVNPLLFVLLLGE